VEEKAQKRYKEKQEGIEHSEEAPTFEEQEALENEKNARMKVLSKEYDETDINEQLKPTPASLDDFGYPH